MKKVLKFKNAPNAIGPYNMAVEANGFIFFSGQIAIVPESGKIVKGGVNEQTHQVMGNIGHMLKELNLDYVDIIKSSIFVKDMNDFAVVNEIYGSYFKEDYPARETVEVARLPKDVLIEISIVVFNSNA